VAGTGTSGTALNTLNAPWGVHVDANLALYVSDRGNHRIMKWPAGILLNRNFYFIQY
jgi:hypothetical protein